DEGRREAQLEGGDSGLIGQDRPDLRRAQPRRPDEQPGDGDEQDQAEIGDGEAEGEAVARNDRARRYERYGTHVVSILRVMLAGHYSAIATASIKSWLQDSCAFGFRSLATTGTIDLVEDPAIGEMLLLGLCPAAEFLVDGDEF